MSKKIIIYTDGGARGNPGPAGVGVVFFEGHQTHEPFKKFKEYIGEATNNQAEYKAVVLALEEAKKIKAEELEFYLDSELVVNQLNMVYKIKDKDLGALFIKIWNLKPCFKKITFRHISREQNKLADRLVNEAIDAA